jgi:hypothetical protein
MRLPSLACCAMLFSAQLFVSCAATAGTLGQDLSSYLFQHDLLSKSYKPLLDQIALDIFRIAGLPEAQVNASYDASKLNILVVRSVEFDHIDVASLPNNDLRRHFVAAKNNFVAVPPNVILIDEAALTRLFLATMAAMTGHNNYGITYVLTRADHGSEGDTALWANAIANMLRVSWLLQLYGDILESKDGYASGRDNVDSALTLSGTEVAATKEAFRTTLAPILLHESAHLSGKDYGGFLDGIMNLILGPDQRSREDAADIFAAKLLATYLDNRKPELASPQQVGLAAFTDYLSLSVLSQATTGLRPQLSASDLLVIFDFYPCETWANRDLQLLDRWKKVAQKASVPVDAPEVARWLTISNEREDNFRNPLLMRAGLSADLFPLTSTEFNHAKDRLLTSLGSGSHSPDLLRADFFSELAVEMLSKSGDARVPARAVLDSAKSAYFYQGRSLLDAATKNDPMLARPPASSRAGVGLVATQKDFMETFERIFVFEPAVNCAPGTCVVGHLKSGRAGFIEVIGNGAQVTKVRLAMKIGQPGDEKFFTEDRLKTFEGKLEATPQNMLLALVIESEAEKLSPDLQSRSGDTVDRISRSIALAMTSCGISSTLDRFGGVQIRSYSMNSDGWLSVVMDAM